MRRVLLFVSSLILTMAAPATALPLEGDWILLHFQDWTGGVFDLYLVHPDGTGLVNLTNGVADDYDGAVSPDGELIAMASNDGTTTEIWVMAVDGTGRRRLTTSGGLWVAWTPDGRILYSRGAEIRSILPDGSDDSLVVDGLPGTANNLAPSPDGTVVVFDVTIDTSRDLYSVPLSGGAMTRLTTDGGFESDWSPDGSQILFTTFRGGYGDNIWVMAPDGSGQRNLVPSPYNDFQPSWSPDGGRIVFHSVRDDFAISIFDIAAGTTVDVVATPDAATFRAANWVRPTGSVAASGGDSPVDPALIALVASLVATAAIGVLLARRSSRTTEPPPPPAP